MIFKESKEEIIEEIYKRYYGKNKLIDIFSLDYYNINFNLKKIIEREYKIIEENNVYYVNNLVFFGRRHDPKILFKNEDRFETILFSINNKYLSVIPKENDDLFIKSNNYEINKLFQKYINEDLKKINDLYEEEIKLSGDCLKIFKSICLKLNDIDIKIKDHFDSNKYYNINELISILKPINDLVSLEYDVNFDKELENIKHLDNYIKDPLYKKTIDFIKKDYK